MQHCLWQRTLLHRVVSYYPSIQSSIVKKLSMFVVCHQHMVLWVSSKHNGPDKLYMLLCSLVWHVYLCEQSMCTVAPRAAIHGSKAGRFRILIHVMSRLVVNKYTILYTTCPSVFSPQKNSAGSTDHCMYCRSPRCQNTTIAQREGFSHSPQMWGLKNQIKFFFVQPAG